MPRVVLDTVVFVRSLINPLGRWGNVVFGRAADHALVVSEPLVAEVLDVLERPEVARKFRYVEQYGPQAVKHRLAGAEVIRFRAISSIARDPNDDMLLATAKEGRADFLVTEDNELLVLGSYLGTAIVDGASFLAVLDSERNDAPRRESPASLRGCRHAPCNGRRRKEGRR